MQRNGYTSDSIFENEAIGTYISNYFYLDFRDEHSNQLKSDCDNELIVVTVYLVFNAAAPNCSRQQFKFEVISVK